MNRSLAYVTGLVLALLLALALRCPQLDARPMHNDEAVNAMKFGELWQKGTYHYDPNEHHGPTLPYATWVLAKITGAPDFAHIDESRLRLLTVLFGVGLILLLPLMADGLGRSATVCAAVLVAVSPAMVFYSRYYIHEMLLVLFTLLALAAGWRYTRSRKLGWAILAGAAIGLMQATKETFVFSLVAAVIALALSKIELSKGDFPFKNMQEGELKEELSDFFKSGEPSGKSFSLSLQTRGGCSPISLLPLGAWFLVAYLLFSSFFTNPNGPLDALRTYQPWLHRAQGESPHIHPWYFYLQRIAGNSMTRGEVVILVLALLGCIAPFTRKGLSDANARFVRFLALYTILLTIIYSLIPYKTPWCLLNFWVGMILLAGVGAVALFQWLPLRGFRFAIAALLLAGTAQLSTQARQASTTYAADPRNPYVYAQTSPNILELVETVNAVSSASPQGNQTVIKVIAPESDYWPLPWYLRDHEQIGWFDQPPADPQAPIMIVSTKLHANLSNQQTHTMVGLYKLRPDVFLELYVETNLWKTYLAGKH